MPGTVSAQPKVERLFFDSVVDALFNRVLGPRLDVATRASLAAAGLDLSQRLRPAYPMEDYFRFVEIAARALFPGRPVGEAIHALGVAFVEGWQGTLIGRAAVQFMLVIGPVRSLKRAAQGFRSGNNFTEVQVVERGPTTFDLQFNVVGPWPEMTAGALLGAMRLSRDIEPKVEILERVGEGAVFRVSWSAKG